MASDSYKFATSVWVDSLMPRDAVMINPHFRFTVQPTDWTTVATAYMNAVRGWIGGSFTNQMQLKIYHDKRWEKGQVNPPVFTRQTNTGDITTTSGMPREVALCLSFYSVNNTRRWRGRVYVPMFLLASGAQIGARPTSIQRDKLGALATIFAAVDGANGQWCVYSPTDDQNYPVTDWWCDDEWDTQRRRGLRSTTRTGAAITG
jgi:hypothetical protein